MLPKIFLNILSHLRAWFVSMGDNWFSDNRTIIIVMGRSIEDMPDDKAKRHLKAVIHARARNHGVEPTLHRIVKRDVGG